jgi:hypothetical protein
MKNTQLLENEYERCLRQIIEASNYIANMALEGDVDKVDLYRSYLHTVIDRAVELKKLLNR